MRTERYLGAGITTITYEGDSQMMSYSNPDLPKFRTLDGKAKVSPSNEELFAATWAERLSIGLADRTLVSQSQADDLLAHFSLSGPLGDIPS